MPKNEFSKPVDTQVAAAESHVWIDCKEAGRYLGYSAFTIRKLAREGRIRRSSNLGNYRFRREWLDEFMLSKMLPPKPKDNVGDSSAD